jgi:RNA polymerase sigma factor (sigma-70 family)
MNAEVLFTAHRQGVHRYLTRIVGHADAAHDLTQEVFLRVSRTQVPDANDLALRAWVFRIARNLALNHIRDRHRRPQSVELADSIDPFGSAQGRPATQELGVAISQALASLQEIDRDVFLMRETAGLSYEDIAAACELTVEAVRGRLRRARQQLREALAGSIDVQRQRGVRIGRGDRQ